MKTRTADWTEIGAVGTSILCLVHCIALPLLIAFLPSLAGMLSVPADLHRWILLLAVPGSGAALLIGRASHGGIGPLLVGSAGLCALASGALLLDGTRLEIPITVLGSLLLAGAHVLNWRRRHASHDHG